MKKRIISILLAVMMIVSLLPMTALAEETEEISENLESAVEVDGTTEEEKYATEGSPEAYEGADYYWYTEEYVPQLDREQNVLSEYGYSRR